MNSSGIKRGLATTAVTALAVAGVPFIATSASAASGDSLGYLSTGALRNGNTAGGEFYLSSSSNDLEASFAGGDLYVVNADYSGTPRVVDGTKEITSAAFDLDIIDVVLRDPNPSNAISPEKYPDGLYHYTVRAAVTTGTASSAKFGLFEDADGNGSVSASDPKVSLDITPTGAPASVEVSPATNTTATNVASPDYNVTVKDAGGKVTQLIAGEALTISTTSDATTTGALNNTTLDDGKATFTATAPTAGTKALEIKGNGATGTPATLGANASLVVIAQAEIDEDEFDLVTGADTWNSETNNFGDTVEVRVDQGAITFQFASKDKSVPADGKVDDANKVVLLTLVGAGNVKFDGMATKTYSVVLDADGKGSLTVNPTGVVAGSTFTFDSDSFGPAAPTTVEMNRATADSVKSDAKVYVTKIGSPTSVSVTVLDQFGNPVGAPAQVSINRGARNGSTTTARQTVDASGKATFSLPDAGTTAGDEVFTINLFEDQFDGSANTENGGAPFAGGTINYTADGLGGNFSITDTSAGSIVPLTDAKADDASEYKMVALVGGTNNAPATVTVDNGAVILGAINDTLDKGKASKSITLSPTGGATFYVAGTKTGTVTVTVESAGRTKTTTLLVKQTTTNPENTARNVELDGPTAANAGQVATYTATVTDAFGNPVPGVPANSLGFSVSGPGNPQNKESVTDASGELEQTVILTDNANSDITVTVKGTGLQFGAKADKLDAAGAAAPGLTASMDTDSVTSEVVNMAELEQAVEDAEEALAEAQADLAIAQGNLDVAEAELAVAQANVESLTAKKQALRQKLNKAKAKGNKQKAKTTRKKLRNVKRNLRAAQDNLTVATTKVDAAQSIVDIREAKVAKAEEDLEQAEQNLEDAQNG